MQMERYLMPHLQHNTACQVNNDSTAFVLHQSFYYICSRPSLIFSHVCREGVRHGQNSLVDGVITGRHSPGEARGLFLQCTSKSKLKSNARFKPHLVLSSLALCRNCKFCPELTNAIDHKTNPAKSAFFSIANMGILINLWGKLRIKRYCHMKRTLPCPTPNQNE